MRELQTLAANGGMRDERVTPLARARRASIEPVIDKPVIDKLSRLKECSALRMPMRR